MANERDKLPVNPSNPSIHIDRPTAYVNGVTRQTTKPTSVYVAHGAQPAEAELTDEDIRKFDLFTSEEIGRLQNWEMELIRQAPCEQVKEIVDKLREKIVDK